MRCTQTVSAAATRWKHFPMGKGGNFNKKLTNFKIVRKKKKIRRTTKKISKNRTLQIGLSTSVISGGKGLKNTF